MAYYHNQLVRGLTSELEKIWPELKLLFDRDLNADIEYRIRNKTSHVVVEFKVNGTYRATIKLQETAGCCGSLTLYEWNINAAYRGRGIGTALLELCEKVAIRTKYTFLLATDNTDTGTAEYMLRKSGWAVMREFKSERTTNTVLVFCKVVTPLEKSIYGS